VDVLVNNAGFGARGPVAGIGVGRQLEMIEVNVAALTRLTALLLPGMLERRRGDLECRLHGRVPAGPELGRVLRDEGVRAVVHRGPGRGSPWLGSAGFVPGPGSDGHRVRGAGRRGGQPAVPAGRDGRRARGPGRARWFAAGQDPGHSRPAQPRPGVLRAPVPADPLSPRSPATCRHRSRLSGSPAAPALRPRPAATNPASTGARRASKNPGTRPLHTTLRNQPPPRARRTLPPFCIESGDDRLRGFGSTDCSLWRADRSSRKGSLRSRRPCAYRSS